MLKMLDVKTKSITEAKKDFSKIIKDISKTGEPTFIFNHNKPEAVILSNAVYEKLVKDYNEMENKLFYSYLNDRVTAGSGELISATEVIESNQEHNPFAALADKDLFD